MEKRVKINKRKANAEGINPRYRLYEDEADLVDNYRRLYNEAVGMGIDPQTVKHGWVKDKHTSLFIKNPSFKTQEQNQIEKLKEEILKEVKNHAVKYPKIKRRKTKEAHLLVIDPADIHIGKLSRSFETGEEYNQQIAVKRCKEGVQGILDKSNGWNIDKILLIIGNDILHTDTPNATTTKGTFQNTDGMWYENFLTAKRLYCDLIEMLIQIADVQVIFNPSNHDYMSGWFLAQLLEVYFSNCKNINFDCSIKHRKYYLYGSNLIGSCHGDMAKQINLGALMSIEAKEYWGDSKHRYFYTHHIHHKTGPKDYINVTVESLRSPSSADSWHYRKGYISPKAIEGFIHSKDFGQVARLTHYF